MKISVYITSYNQKDLLAEAIESVLAQTLKPHEIIIVDDASTDDSPEMIRGYASRYPELIRPIFHSANTGVSRTRVDALTAATGDFATCVDGDDRYLPRKLEKEAARLAASPSARMAFSDFYYIDEAGDRTGRWAESGTPPEGDIFTDVFARRFPGTDLFRMELVHLETWKRVGFFDVDLPVYEDYDMRIRLTKECRAVYVDEPLAEYRRRQAGLSSTPPDRQLEILRRVYRKNRHLLLDLDGAKRRETQRHLFARMAPFALAAGRGMLCDSRVGPIRRRAKAAALFAFCARHGPDLLALGDLYRLLFPARTAENLTDRLRAGRPL
ncbi:glycosyltransferase family 2 protein [Verrucomicrobiota bacterium]